MSGITMTARFHETEDGAVDLSGFDMIEITRGTNKIRIRIHLAGDCLVVSGDGSLVIRLGGANRFEIPIESQP